MIVAISIASILFRRSRLKDANTNASKYTVFSFVWELRHSPNYSGTILDKPCLSVRRANLFLSLFALKFWYPTASHPARRAHVTLSFAQRAPRISGR